MPEKKIENDLPINSENVFVVDKNTVKVEDKIELSQEKDYNLDNIQKKSSSTGEKGVERKTNTTGSLVQSSSSKKTKEIENILEIDLADIFNNLSLSEKRKFKSKGEETARNINILIGATKIKVKKILYLIKEWLKIIPGVNKFFIEQLAKNKLDEILKLKNK